VLGPRSKAVVNAGTHETVRLVVPAAPGYAAAASAAVHVP
jgi:hypothetical protein